MRENFRPIPNLPPNSLFGKMMFHGRMMLDLQLFTVYSDVKKEVSVYKGHVLDVGCGKSPYKFLLNTSQIKYFGIDIVDAQKFDYSNHDIISFNGEDIPFDKEKFDGVICTDVLEHVQNYQKITDEIYRIMKFGAKGIITIPWSARYHYIPHDYFRYTPSSLKMMFSKFSNVEIRNRGTDITVIANKIIVIWFRKFFHADVWRWIFLPLWIAISPILIIIVIIAHLSLLLNWGSNNDPLGYTIILKK
ncbi:MAG: class I SAM-dependent methyltransferase [Oligoflexia bacterium]|nr:class I SAM-dependent methyltransferase [Oligoflexia bacterium]